MSAMTAVGMAACSGEGWINDAVSFWQRQRTTTGIRSVSINAQSNRSHTIYGPDGQRRDSLRHGINILNGKKIYIK